MKRVLSILLTISLLMGMAVLSASAAEIADIRVELGEIPYYHGYQSTFIPVTVTAGGKTLVKNQDYSLTYSNDYNPTNEAKVTVTGKGDYAGYEETFTYPILRREISNDNIRIEVEDVLFTGDYVTPEISVFCNGSLLFGWDYVAVYENNINAGTGTVRVIGRNSVYGYAEAQFQIVTSPVDVLLRGQYLGKVDGTLSNDYKYEEKIISPGKVTARVNIYGSHVAAYALYRVEGEYAELVTEYTSPEGIDSRDTAFTYDFSSIYEGIEESSSEIYLLSYSWVNHLGSVYAGVMRLEVPSKVGPATSMTLTEQKGDSNFRTHYLSAVGVDGTIGDVSWSSADPATATVEEGVVTFKKPGTVTVTARSGNLSASKQLTQETLDITEAMLYDYSAEKGAQVIYDYRLLEEGTDYTLSVEQKDGQNIVTVTGCGLFKGQLVRSFDAQTGKAAEHTHRYTGICEPMCTDCNESRPGGHNFGKDWLKNTTHHWHKCSTCGELLNKAEHVLIPSNSDTCYVCGKLYLPGDFDGDWLVTESDVIWLLWHTVDPTSYPLVSSGDYDGDGNITEADVIHLLWHTVDPDNYPLN